MIDEDQPEQDELELAEWSAAFMNDLPDSAFLYISPGGEKDDDGKTTPRALRHFPYRGPSGKVDLPHLRNAIGRIPQSTAAGLTREKMQKLQERARAMLRAEEPEEMAEPDADEKALDPRARSKAKGLPWETEDAEQMAETDEEREKREKAEAKAKADADAKAKGEGKTSGRGMGNPASRRYYADAPGFWGAPRRVILLDEATSWVEVVRSGTFYGSMGPKPRRVTLTPDDVLGMAASYTTILAEGWFNGGAPVGVNHASAFGARDAESTKAMARITRVVTRSNDDGTVSLWGNFAWTDEGARRIRAGEFSSVSAELIPPATSTSKLTGEPMHTYALVGATMTNSPMIPGMRPPSISDTVAPIDDGPHRVALSEARLPTPTEKNPMPNDFLLRLAEATGLPAEGPELLTEIQRLQNEAEKVVVLTEALNTATTDSEGLRERNAHLEDREKGRVLDEACSLGRIAPTERDTYWRTMDAVGEKEGHRVFHEGRVPVGKTSESAPADATVENTAEASFLALIDKALADGKAPQDAWDIARALNTETLYSAVGDN